MRRLIRHQKVNIGTGLTGCIDLEEARVCVKLLYKSIPSSLLSISVGLNFFEVEANLGFLF